MKKVLFFILVLLSMSACSFDIHKHTFSDHYSYDQNYHWKASTCGHDVVQDKELHAFHEENSHLICEVCGYEKGSGNVTNDRDNIKVAEKIIANVYDSCSSNGLNVKSKKRAPLNSSLEQLVNEESKLSGSFHYQDRNVDGFLKVSSEPLGFAFGLLEFFVQNGLPENDFSEKLYFNPHSHVIGINTEMSYTKITLISEHLLNIDYGGYHMILGEDGDISFVMSYGYSSDYSTDYMDALYFEYFSNGPSLIYSYATLNWKDEIDLAIEYLKQAENFTTLPLEIMKDMYFADGVERPIRYHYDKNNINHVVLPTYDSYSFTSPGIIQEYFMYVHYDAKFSSPWMIAIVEDEVLKYVYGSGMKLFEVPSDVKVIENLANRPEDTPYKTTYFGILFHNTDVEFMEGAFDKVKAIDSIFIDSVERNDQFENQITEYFPNVHFYYQDEWEIKCDLILPKVEIVEDDSDHVHVFTRQIVSDEYLAQEANCTHGTCYYYVCEECDKHGNQFYEVGEKGDHNYVENGSWGTYTGYICSICGLQYSHNNLDTEHHFVLIEAVPATCTEDGYYLYRCKITGEEKIETQEKFHHCFAGNATCIRCHIEKITYEEHDFIFVGVGEIEIYMVCKICGDEYLQLDGFMGHEFENGICTFCHLIEHEHKFGEAFEAKGTNYHACNICGYIVEINEE